MSVTAPPMGQTWTGRPEPMTNLKAGQQCPRGIHPDVWEMAAELGVTRPRTVMLLQVDYDRHIAAKLAAEDWVPVLTRASIRGSKSADPEGDRSTKKIDRERSAA